MGTNFQSELFKNVCKILKIKKKSTSPWHPQSNGSLERSHRTLKEYLRCYIEDIDDWNSFVEFGIFTMNTTKNEATGYTPYELLYGYKVTVPKLTTLLTTKPEPRYNYDDYMCELKYKLQLAHKIARDSQIQSKGKNKSYYDKKSRPIHFQEGDKVLMINHTQKGEGRKLQPKFTGPYIVTKIISPTNVTIKIGRKNKIVHNNLLKLFHEDQIESDE